MDHVERLVQLEYLGLGEADVAGLLNPFERRTPREKEEPHLHVLRLMRNPDYFYYTCKTLFNIELFPFQCVILKEMWTRRFPMLIASRGAGKSFLLGLYAVLRALLKQGSKVVICGSGFRQAKTVFNYAENIWHNSPMLQSLMADSARSGPEHSADRWALRLGESTITALPIGDGSRIRGERANCILGDEFACLDATTLVETDRGLMRIADSFDEEGFALFTGNATDIETPDCFIKTPLTDAYRVITKGGYEFICSSIHKVSTERGWALGKDLIPGDLLYCSNHYQFPEDVVVSGGLVLEEDLAWAVGLMVAEGCVTPRGMVSVHMTDEGCVRRFADVISRYGVNVGISECEPYDDPRGWAAKRSWTAYFCNLNFRNRLADLGLERVTAHGKRIPWSVLRSPKRVVLAFLRGLFEGDGSAFHWKDRQTRNKLGIAYYSVSETLCREVQIVLKKLDVFCTRQSRASNLSDLPQWMLRLNGAEALSFGRMVGVAKWRETVDGSYEAALAEHKRGVVWLRECSKWRACGTLPCGKQRNIGRFIERSDAVAAVEDFEEGQGEYLKVRSVERLPGQRHLYDYHIPKSHSFMGNGFRQHNSIPAEIFETVISGFGVVNLNPVSQAKKAARGRVLKKLGVGENSLKPQEKNDADGNQILISGTAFWQFNHFYKYWQKWKTVIECRGDQGELRKRLGETLDDSLDWRDFMVIRYPYHLLPESYYDIAQISRSRMTHHSGTFANEFEACTAPEELVITASGPRPMADVEVGDLVLTHRGRFRHVVGKTRRPYKGGIVRYKTMACGFESRVTPDHPYWTPGDRWETLGDLAHHTCLANLQELSGLTEFDLRPVVRDHLEADGLIYPRPGNTKLTREEFAAARSATGTCAEIARELGVSYNNVWQARGRRGKRYNSIPKTVRLDFDLGLVIGYYASEGSMGSSGRAVNFSLDGHVGTGLEAYVEQLRSAITSSFGIGSKRYDASDNVASVVITQSLVADFIKWVCPGLSHAKSVRPEVLFSNGEFLRGFLTGYWNGDGHLPGECGRGSPKAASVSLDLATQVRTALSYFGITAAIRLKRMKDAEFRGKLYKTRQSYDVVLSGENDRLFRRLFYGQDPGPAPGKTKAVNAGGHSELPFVERETEPYDGLVYNLEVDEDNSYSLMNATVHNCFSGDSKGFYRRSVIEACTTSKAAPVTPEVEGADPVWFNAVTRGNPTNSYVIGVDPAAEEDNFAIVVVEVHETHNRVVYCWTTNKQKFNARSKGHLVEDHTYYGYCARKIRDLLRAFACDDPLIALDAQGGGQNGVLEELHNPANMKQGEQPIWPITTDHSLSDGKERESDSRKGLHIVELVNFSDAKWTSGANHGMRKDLELKQLLFPQRDAVTIAEAFLKDQEEQRLFDTLEDCVDEIDELKEELSTISYTQTPGTLRDKWDTPEIKVAGSKKGRMRKDRYSALLMANFAARRMTRKFSAPEYQAHGGFADRINPGGRDAAMYDFAPDWFTQQSGGDYSDYGWASGDPV